MKHEHTYASGKSVQRSFHHRSTVIILALLFTLCGFSVIVSSAASKQLTPALREPNAVERVSIQPTPRVSTKAPPDPPHVAFGEWPGYSLDSSRSGFNRFEHMINATTAPNLQPYWTYSANASISVQPVVANKTIYWGSWDGLEHATALDGHEVWATNLGTTTDNDCDPSTVGIASTAVVAPLQINGTTHLVVFVGGGNAQFYALDAADGKILWSTPLGSPPAAFIWSSPTVFDGSVYVGLASFGDCPSVQGKLFQMSMATGNIEHVFNIVPDGCLGGSIWGSPSIDAKTRELYIATGNPDTCSTTEPNATSLLKLHASDLSLVDSWQVPSDQRVIDSDFGSAPTLFTATIGGVSQNLVGVAHKNGIFYAFERDAIGNGPIWEAQIASGGSCPECGQGSISPAAWDGSMLYVAGGNTTIDGASCAGSVRALDPATGNFLWEACIGDGPVLAPVTVVPGVVVVTAGPSIIAIDAKSAKTLFTFTDSHPNSIFYGAATIAEGVLYAGNVDGNLYAFGLYLRTPHPRMR